MIPTMLIIQQWRAVSGIVLANPDVPMVKLEKCDMRVNRSADFGSVVASVTT